MNELQPGQCAYIQAVDGEGALRHHLLDMGLTPGTEITLQKIAPMGDPVQIKVRCYELTLRLEEAQKIEIDGIHPEETCNPEKERALNQAFLFQLVGHDDGAVAGGYGDFPPIAIRSDAGCQDTE